MASRVYADYNATAPLREMAVTAMTEAMRAVGNPSSVHGPGRAARALIEKARAQVGALIGAPSQTIVFTSGGTEASALALKGSGRRRIVTSAIEHEAVLAAVPDAIRIPVDAEGVLDLGALRSALAEGGADTLVSVQWANNETGVLQPIEDVVAVAKEHGALVHSDAVQAAGKVPVDVISAGLDLLSLSAHKIGGPAGVGALFVREGLDLSAQQTGGGQEKGRRSGTENKIGIVGFGAAAAQAMAEMDDWDRVRDLRDRFEVAVREAGPGARIFSADAPRLPNTSCVSLTGTRGETQVISLDLAGVAVSSGSACSSGKVRRSHVLDAMDPGTSDAETAIRVSLGWDSTDDDIDRLVAAWRGLYNRAGAETQRSA
ncbi:cysteine desulfurase [Nisaea acidiphila]|uniref:Cysteine desulfurase n=1 Tax=Nisaea acidiphila TaxID=1862145 RepID=A0A9J7AU06_9PROT|nr:cysteine desulfurase family protein [Nisaea acidiphila]UUX50840.1 cysteine desulfurase [Nisaea acidiphila]